MVERWCAASESVILILSPAVFAFRVAVFV
jgi:hypothetical protein